MGAQILNLANARRVCSAPANLPEPARPYVSEHFGFWQGASDTRYVHTIYDIVRCPDLPQANYMLVRRETDGSQSVLYIGQTKCQAASLNLAEIRTKAARLGADEVHVYFLARSDKARLLAEFDLRAGQFASLSASPAATAH